VRGWGRGAWPKEGERRREKKGMKKKRRREKRKRGNKEREGKEKEKGFRKLWEILGKFRREGKGILVGFFPGSNTSRADAVSTVTLVGWPYRRGLGIPSKVADSGAAAVVCDMTQRAVVVRVMEGGMGGASGVRGTRAEGRGEGKDDWGFGETIELSGKVLKNTRDLAGDLLGVKTWALQGRHKVVVITGGLVIGREKMWQRSLNCC
jgi:hypothetical protein